MKQIINQKGIPLPEELNKIAHREEQKYNPGWGANTDEKEWLNDNLEWSETDQKYNFWKGIYYAKSIEEIFEIFKEHYGRSPDTNWTPPPPPTIEEIFKF